MEPEPVAIGECSELVMRGEGNGVSAFRFAFGFENLIGSELLGLLSLEPAWFELLPGPFGWLAEWQAVLLLVVRFPFAILGRGEAVAGWLEAGRMGRPMGLGDGRKAYGRLRFSSLGRLNWLSRLGRLA